MVSDALSHQADQFRSLLNHTSDAEGPDDDPIEPDLSILQINLKAYMYTVKLATHYFSRNNSPDGDKCLIMTASLAGYLDQPGSPQYCASKWGVRGLMHSLRQTMPGMGMRVNIIAPWFVRTRIMSQQVQDLVESKGIAFAEKGDAAQAVLHMAADKSINGTFSHRVRVCRHPLIVCCRPLVRDRPAGCRSAWLLRLGER